MKLEYDPKADAAYFTQCAGVPFAFTHHAGGAPAGSQGREAAWPIRCRSSGQVLEPGSGHLLGVFRQLTQAQLVRDKSIPAAPWTPAVVRNLLLGLLDLRRLCVDLR